MNSDTSNESPFPTSAGMSGGTSGLSSGSTLGASAGSSYNNGSSGSTVQRMAQKAHEAVDKLEQSIGSGSEKMMGLQEEYGQMAREQVRNNPLGAVAIAFGVGILFSKLFMR